MFRSVDKVFGWVLKGKDQEKEMKYLREVPTKEALPGVEVPGECG